jgi:hypothetical protein
VYRGIAELALARGDAAKAREAAAKGIAIVEREYGPSHVKLVNLLRFAADAEERLGGVSAPLRERADAIERASGSKSPE